MQIINNNVHFDRANHNDSTSERCTFFMPKFKTRRRHE